MVLRFGPFELDTEQEELRRSGLVLRLPRQPMRLLLLFVRRAGEVITRDEIQQALWGSETHVDYEQGINAAIRQIRYHLADNAEAPRYVKTIPRRGYVWIAPVEEVVLAPAPLPAPVPNAAPRRKRSRITPFVVVAVIVVIAIASWRAFPRRGHTIAVTPFRVIGALPPGVDPNAYTQEVRSAIVSLSRKRLVLREEPAKAEVRIDGTIRRDGDSVRVIVSGIDVISGTQLWTGTYERRVGEHGDLAMQTAHRVAHEVMRRFLPPPRHEPLLRTKVPPRVLAVYRRARLERLRSLPDANGDRAAALFEEVLRAEPKFAEAWSGLADVWGQRATMGTPSELSQAVAKARSYAARALALQPGNAEARSELALIALQYEWNLAAAEESFRAAVASDPEYVDAIYNLSQTLSARGEFDDAIETYEQARELDPIDFDLHPTEGMLYLRARRWDEAIAKYREILRFHESAPAQWGLLWASGHRRDWVEATAVMRTMLDLPPRPPGVAATEAEYRDLLGRLEANVLQLREHGVVDDFFVAAYYSERGDRDASFRALERAIARHAPVVVFLLVDPRFDTLRDDPRYAAIAARIR